MELDAYRKMAETEDEHWWFSGRRAIADAVIGTLRLPDDARIVEIGAGTGGNIAMLERWGAVTAVEMNELARSIAFEKTGRRFLAGHLPDDLPLEPKSADLVCLFDVLEHVAEDEDSLLAIHRLLRPGGRVILTVPAHQWLWSAHDVGLHHMRRYSRDLLRSRVEAAGFKLERLSYTNAALFPLAIAARLLDRLLNSGSATGQAMPPKPVNAALKALFSAESGIVSSASLPFGVSLLAVFGADARDQTTSFDNQIAA